MSITVEADTPEGQLVLQQWSQAQAFRSLIPDSEWQRVEAYFGQDGGGGSSGGGSSGGGGSSEPSGSPDVRIVDFGLSSGFPDQTPPLAAGDRVTFEIALTNQGTQDKNQQGFVVEADGQQVFDGALASPTSTSTKRNLRVNIPSVSQQTEVSFCARLDNGREQCVSLPVVPGFDPDAVTVESITVPDQITLGDNLSGTFRVRNPNPTPADIRWRVDFEGPVVDDGVARVPGETVVEIDYSGRGPEEVALFDVCARLDSVTPS